MKSSTKYGIKFATLMILGFAAWFGGLWYFIDYLPQQNEIQDGYKYRSIIDFMESEDANHYLPTIKKSMEDGKFQEFEYKKLREIKDNLDLKREKAAFMKLWKTIV